MKNKLVSRSKLAMFLLFVIGCWTILAGQQPTPTPQKQDEQTTGSITGKVVNESGQPLAGATVFLRSVGGSNIAGRTTSSDSEGNFQLASLDPALYMIFGQIPAYTSAPRDPDAPPVYYRIGDNVRLELFRGGVITGIVTNNAGEPVIAVRVRAYMVRDVKGQPTNPAFLFGNERSTDDRGVFRIYGLLPGTYVVFAGGSSIQTYQISPYDLDAPTYAPSSTRDNATEFTIRAGEETNVDIRYRGEPGRSVSGTVTNLTGSGASISMTAVGSQLKSANTTFMQPGTRGFAFYGITDGDYDLVATQTAQQPGMGGVPDTQVSEPRRIKVRGSDVSGLELTVKPMALISGRFVLQPSQIADCKDKRRPVFAETIVDLVRNSKTVKETDNLFRFYAVFGQPDKDGAFTLRNLIPAEYALSPRFFARYWYIQSIAITSATPAANSTPGKLAQKTDAGKIWTTVKFGDRVGGVTITIAEGAASIRGQVTVSENAQLPERLSVYLVPAERDKSDDVFRYFSVESQPDGTFGFNNLAPGKYLLITQVSSEPELTPDKIRLPTSAEARVKLRRAAEAGKNEIELKPCQNLTDKKFPFSSN